MTDIRLIVFDLDGVLVDSRPLHYYALNDALSEIDPKYIISHDEHIAKYDGNTTTTKLKMLVKDKNLPDDKDLHNKIWQLKQIKTRDHINRLNPDSRIIEILKKLKNDGYTLYCASNSIWNTVKTMLLKKGFLEYFDYFISNEDVKYPKPDPEIYLKCIQRKNISPTQTLIIEDSPIGITAANRSGCNVLPVSDTSGVTYDNIINKINECNRYNKNITDIRLSRNINIVIPMAGLGSRFSKVGYTFPKPLIDVNGKPMIQLVVENLNINGNYIFIVQREHCQKYCLKYLLNLIAPNCKIIELDGVTDGAARSVLKAKNFIDNDIPLLIANSDQYLEWNSDDFIYSMLSDGIDGGISTFYSTHPKWSYAKLDNDGYVTQVQEKVPISEHATTGIYFWTRGSDYVKYAEQMINNNIKVKNEFYVCPVYNEAIKDGKKIKIKDCYKMWGIGTPEDLSAYMAHHK